MSQTTGMATSGSAGGSGMGSYSSQSSRSQQSAKSQEVRNSNVTAVKAVVDLIRTSLGPKGLDKMVTTAKGDVLITNDGATIMKQLEVRHPAAHMLVELAQAQDVAAGDGTTSVVVLCGSILAGCPRLFELGIHPTAVSEGIQRACHQALKFLNDMARPIDLDDTEILLKNAKTSLASKVISPHADKLAPLAVNAVLAVRDPAMPNNVDLGCIKVVKSVGGTLDDCMLVDGLVFPRRAMPARGKGIDSIVNPRIGLIRFCLSPPKTDMDSSVQVSTSDDIDNLLRHERQYLMRLCKAIKETGCNLLLIQKSILRDALDPRALFFLTQFKIMVISDIERSDMDFVARATGATPVATVEEFKADKLGGAESVRVIDGMVHVTNCRGTPNAPPTRTLLVRGSNKLIVDEAERSLHDAMCVIRSLVKSPRLLPGGGACETELALSLRHWSEEQGGCDRYCAQVIADALEVIPTTLAENAGMKALKTLSELYTMHADGKKFAGINCHKGAVVENMFEQDVIQPFLVTGSALELATETARMILKVDDIVLSNGSQ